MRAPREAGVLKAPWGNISVRANAFTCPPAKRWQAVVRAATETEADRQLHQVAVGHRLADLLVLPAGRDPNQRRRIQS